MIATRRALAALLAFTGAGCGNELGKCDKEAAQELVYGRGNLVATKGQALIHDSCGQGATCHASAAEGKARHGAPHGLNFDMLPRASGLARVLEERESIWDTIQSGLMPPKGFALGDGDWTFSVARSSDESRLPSLTSDEGKAAVRNWLACGAPIVQETRIPGWATPGSGVGDGSWSDLHTNLIAPRCATAGCHDSRSASVSGSLDLSERCAARLALLKAGPCGEVRVKPGDAASLLVDKIASETPRCNARMPPSGAFSEAETASVRAWVVAGAIAADCP